LFGTLDLIDNLVELFINAVVDVEFSIKYLVAVVDELICFTIDIIGYVKSGLTVELETLTEVLFIKGEFSITDLVIEVLGIEITLMLGLSLSGLEIVLEILGNIVIIDKVLFFIKCSVDKLEILGIKVVEGVLIIFEELL